MVVKGGKKKTHISNPHIIQILKLANFVVIANGIIFLSI